MSAFGVIADIDARLAPSFVHARPNQRFTFVE